MSKIGVKFTEDRVRGYSVYTITVDDVEVVHLYGSMAAIASEVVCRFLENDNVSVRVGDVFDRIRANEALTGLEEGPI